MIKNYSLLITFLSALFIHLNCIASPPKVISFSPNAGTVGTVITIQGENFGITNEANLVYFGATKAEVTSASSTQLTVIVPSGATYSPISVLVNGLIAYSSKPFIVTFSPSGSLNNNSFAPKVDFAAGACENLVIVDLNNDGKPDCATTDVYENFFSVFTNTSASEGIISFSERLDFLTDVEPTSIKAGDIDADGRIDIILCNYGSSNIVIYRNTTEGDELISFNEKFTFDTHASTGSDQYNTSSVSVGDFDGDGRLDLVATNSNTQSISIFRNFTQGPGLIDYGDEILISTSEFSNPYSSSIADIDSDSKPDLIVVNSGASTISIYRNTSNGIGSISFDDPINIITGSGLDGNSPYYSAIGDFDADGLLDIVVSNYGSSSVSVFRNSSVHGSIEFNEKLDFTTGTGLYDDLDTYHVTVGDLDGDGKPDIIATNSNSSTISLLRNISTGLGLIDFDDQIQFSTEKTTGGTAIGDLDGDGKPEIAVTNFDEFTALSVFRNIISGGTNSITLELTPSHTLIPVNSEITLEIKTSGEPSKLIVDWGESIQSVDNPEAIVSLPHIYTTAGVYSIHVTALGDNGDSVEETSEFIVVFDPNGGFVTGGGWFDSPPNALSANSLTVGKANFGITLKYRPKAAIPTGNLEFQFGPGSINFKASQFDWLVVSCTQAQFKGVGQINGYGNYGVLVTVADRSTDAIRVKIWDKTNDSIVYDNQIGSPENSKNATPLGGGSIVIHDPGCKISSHAISNFNAPNNSRLLSIYPNPVNNNIQIQFNERIGNQVEIEIVDFNGRILSSRVWEVSSEDRISINDLSLQRGLYLLRIKYETGVEVIRFNKN